MTAYLIARVNVTDPVRYAKYRAHTPRVIAQFGGRFIVRGGEVEALEGPDEGLRIVVIEFPDLAAAKAFYASPEYTAVRALRAGAGVAQVAVVDGYDGAGWDAVVAASQALPPPPAV